MTLENVAFTGLLYPSCVVGSKIVPLTVTLKDVTAGFRKETQKCGYGLFEDGVENLRVIKENILGCLALLPSPAEKGDREAVVEESTCKIT